MPNYRRAFVPGGCWFFTVNLLERRQTLLVDNIAALREAVPRHDGNYAFTIDAIVVLPIGPRVARTRWAQSALRTTDCVAPSAIEISDRRVRQSNATGKSLLIFRNCVKQRIKKNQKYSASVVGQISDLNPPVSPDKRGDRDRHERAVGCGGRDARARRTRAWRTAKTCGPDTATLVSSFCVSPQRRWWQESPFTRESTL